MRTLALLLFSFTFVLTNSDETHAQQVVFNLNLKPQLADSVFIPGRDVLQITGSEYPLNTAAPVIMRDLPPIDSIYTATVRFSSRLTGKTIQYNFEMMLEGRRIGESLPRTLLIPADKTELDALYFDAFAW